jgi:hypothetical protein
LGLTSKESTKLNIPTEISKALDLENLIKVSQCILNKAYMKVKHRETLSQADRELQARCVDIDRATGDGVKALVNRGVEMKAMNLSARIRSL